MFLLPGLKLCEALTHQTIWSLSEITLSSSNPYSLLSALTDELKFCFRTLIQRRRIDTSAGRIMDDGIYRLIRVYTTFYNALWVQH